MSLVHRRLFNESFARAVDRRAKQASVSAASASTSAMICLVPPPAVADSLKLPGGEVPTDMHLTLLYYKDGVGDVDRSLRLWASQQQPISGLINGIARFSSDDPEGDPIVVLADVPGLFELRASLIESAPAGWAADHDWTPHCTVAYKPFGVDGPSRVAPREVTFDAVWLWAGGERRRYNFGEY